MRSNRAPINVEKRGKNMMKKIGKFGFIIIAIITAFFAVQTILIESGVRLHLDAKINYREKVVTVDYIEHERKLFDF